MTHQLLTQAHVMAVDDSPANLRLLQQVLQHGGYQRLTLVPDPTQVLHHYQRQRPDLILLDLQMPAMDGLAVMAALQTLHDPLLPPIVVLTAQQGTEHVLRALSSGARDFVTKPFHVTELLMRVRNLLEAQLAHRLLHDQAATLHTLVRQRTEELRQSQWQVVQHLCRAAEYRDNETGQHILRMSHMSARLARAIGWDASACDLLLHASPMHDIGKLGIPDAILLKPGGFEPHEWRVMQRHTVIGAEILGQGDSELMQMASTIALHHHEKWNGSGYPHGLAGADIPQAARIVALADVFDALTSARPYKPAWSIERATQHLQAQSGVHFDPHLVVAFLQHLDEMLAIRQRFQETANTPARPPTEPAPAH